MKKLLIPALLIMLIFQTPSVFGQGAYSNLGIWNESGVWIGVHGGLPIPVGRLMRNYHKMGYSGFISLEFPRTFTDIGIEIGVQRFYGTSRYENSEIMPINIYIRLTLLEIGMHPGYKEFFAKTGIGGGVYINRSSAEYKYFPGFYVPLVLSYRFSQTMRADLDIRGYEVLGDIATEEGSDDYLEIQVSVSYFFPF